MRLFIGKKNVYLTRNWKKYLHITEYVVVQSLSCIQIFATPWSAAGQASLSFTISEFAQIHVHRVSDAIQPSYPLSSPFLPLSLSQHQGFSNE